MNTKAMYNLSYGLFVLTAKNAQKDNGCIINTAIQAASDPNQISICVNKANFTHDIVKETGEFTVSIISQKASFDLFKRFGFQSGRNVDKFDAFSGMERGANGIYYITEGTNGYISVKVEKTEDLGSHTMFIGTVTDMEVLSDEASATYAYYFEHIKPKPEAVGKTEDGQTVWRCRICGYEYVGEEIPADFICPICKHPASDFEKIIKKAGTPEKPADPLAPTGAPEKHRPVVTMDRNHVIVDVGEVTHPMEEAHSILYIEIETDKGVHRRNLKPGDKPVAEFFLPADESLIKTKALCNLHGLWEV